MDSQYIGKYITRTSSRTGKKISYPLLLARSFDTGFEFQMFMMEIYTKDYGYYQIYAKTLADYLRANPDNLPEIEIVENAAVLSTINAMFFVRDRVMIEMQHKAHLEMQEFIQSLTKTQK